MGYVITISDVLLKLFIPPWSPTHVYPQKISDSVPSARYLNNKIRTGFASWWYSKKAHITRIWFNIYCKWIVDWRNTNVQAYINRCVRFRSCSSPLDDADQNQGGILTTQAGNNSVQDLAFSYPITLSKILGYRTQIVTVSPQTNIASLGTAYASNTTIYYYLSSSYNRASVSFVILGV